MAEPENREFYLRREGEARALAENATSSGIKEIHLDMASRYAEMARVVPTARVRPILRMSTRIR